MKKFTVLLLLAIMVLGFNGWTQVFMTELADPNNNSNARFIELYNIGATDVDFTEGSGWLINKFTNGSATVSNSINLTGTILAGDFYIIAYDLTPGTFLSVYGFAPDQLDAVSNGVAGANGDDTFQLIDGTGTVVDFYGVQPHADLTGSVWEYEDGRAERANGATSGTNPPVDADWNTWSDGPGGNVIQAQNAPEDFDPDSWIGATAGPYISVTPTALNGFVYEFGNGPSTEQTFTVEGSDLTDNISINPPTNYEISLDNASYQLTPITLTQSGGLVTSTLVYTRLPVGLSAGDYIEDITISSTGATTQTVSCNGTVEAPATTTLPYSEPFDTDLGDCYTYSVSGDLEAWYWHSSGYAAMNGFNTGDTEEDWLIIPAINFDNYSNETMTFDTWYNYGSDDVNNYLKLYYSTTYVGIGDPTAVADWIEIPFTQPSGASTWTSSGMIDLSSITGSSVYIGFKYRYEPGNYRWWEVDNILIEEVSPILSADFTGVPTSVYEGGIVSFTSTVTGGTPPYTYSWDLDFDGSEDSDLANPTFNYSTAGLYTVELTVTDNALDSDTESKVNYIEVLVNPFGLLVINEVDADQDGTDDQEFVELYDGGVGGTDLSGLVLVFYNGSDNASYNTAYDLDGFSTNANGYFVLGSSIVPNVDMLFAGATNQIQNGEDAVALHVGDGVDFPNDTPVTNANLIDAIVYGTNDPDATVLLNTLTPGQPQVNESGRGSSANHSNQRLPNGSGGQLVTTTYDQSNPTPGIENSSVFTDWTGAVDSNWDDAGNWTNGIPTALLDAAIPDVGANPFPVISVAGAVCNQLFVAADAELYLNVNGDLTTNGTFTNSGTFTIMTDGTTNVGSYIDNGGTSGGGTFHFYREMMGTSAAGTDHGWHFISPPTDGLTSDQLLPDYYLNWWDEANDTWIHVEGGDCSTPAIFPFENGVGYSVLRDLEYTCPNPVGNTMDFGGPFYNMHNSGDVFSVTYTDGGTFEGGGWNLFGNPYTSPIDNNTMVTDVAFPATLNAAVYIYNDNSTDYIEFSGGVGVAQVPATQGFFMQAIGAGTLTFDNAWRTHNGSDNFYKDAVADVLELSVIGNGYSDNIFIRFHEDATVGFDRMYDAHKLLSSAEHVPQIYTTNGANKLAINALPATPIVPMGFTSVSSGEYTISAIETSEFANVILEDRFTWQQTDLLTDSYTFNYNVNDDADRFFIHFTPLGIGDQIANSIQIWSENHNIHVQSPEVNADIVVYNMMGQEITRTNIEAGLNVVPVTDVNAFYVVKIVGSEVSKTGKVYVK